MDKRNEKKYKQLGMPLGTATGILRKNIMFSLIQKLGMDVCFQCGDRIKHVNELSIEHKIPWLDSDNPKELFFSLDNIAFSHLSCNIGASKKREWTKHGAFGYRIKKCRCAICKAEKAVINKRYRSK